MTCGRGAVSYSTPKQPDPAPLGVVQRRPLLHTLPVQCGSVCRCAPSRNDQHLTFQVSGRRKTAVAAMTVVFEIGIIDSTSSLIHGQLGSMNLSANERSQRHRRQRNRNRDCDGASTQQRVRPDTADRQCGTEKYAAGMERPAQKSYPCNSSRRDAAGMERALRIPTAAAPPSAPLPPASSAGMARREPSSQAPARP